MCILHTCILILYAHSHRDETKYGKSYKVNQDDYTDSKCMIFIENDSVKHWPQNLQHGACHCTTFPIQTNDRIKDNMDCLSYHRQYEFIK